MVVRTTTTVSLNPTVKQENKLHSESQGFVFHTLIRFKIKRNNL